MAFLNSVLDSGTNKLHNFFEWQTRMQFRKNGSVILKAQQNYPSTPTLMSNHKGLDVLRLLPFPTF